MLALALGLVYTWAVESTDTQRDAYLFFAWAAWLWALVFAFGMPVAAAWRSRDFAFLKGRHKRVLGLAAVVVLAALLMVEGLRNA
jgi:hypothetical protein